MKWDGDWCCFCGQQGHRAHDCPLRRRWEGCFGRLIGEERPHA